MIQKKIKLGQHACLKNPYYFNHSMVTLTNEYEREVINTGPQESKKKIVEYSFSRISKNV